MENLKTKYVKLGDYKLAINVIIVQKENDPSKTYLNYKLNLDGYIIDLKPKFYNPNDLVVFKKFVDDHKK